ncbi:MAG: signal peptidase II [Deltaproteobacteria bacterium]|nr:signal peptidase II [Deltaproteobacteria bacterium]
MGKMRLIAAITAVSVFAADMITKAVITHTFMLGESREVAAGFFNVVYVINRGAAFSFLANAGLLGTVFLISASIVALGVLAYLINQSKNPLTSIALSLVAGGAVGNLVDRARLGFVVDFLDVHVKGYHWPAFNVADSAITIGVGLAVYAFYIKKQQG